MVHRPAGISDPQDRCRMPQGEGRGALKPRVDRLGEGKNVSIYTQFAPQAKSSPFLPYIGSSAPYSPRIREASFSETQKAIRQEKGRGVENPGGKVSWAMYWRGVIVSCPAYSTVTMTSNYKAVKR